MDPGALPRIDLLPEIAECINALEILSEETMVDRTETWTP